MTHAAGRDRATSPKIYWHHVSQAVIKALGSRKANGAGERREGKRSQQAFCLPNKTPPLKGGGVPACHFRTFWGEHARPRFADEREMCPWHPEGCLQAHGSSGAASTLGMGERGRVSQRSAGSKAQLHQCCPPSTQPEQGRTGRLLSPLRSSQPRDVQSQQGDPKSAHSPARSPAPCQAGKPVPLRDVSFLQNWSQTPRTPCRASAWAAASIQLLEMQRGFSPSTPASAS